MLARSLTVSLRNGGVCHACRHANCVQRGKLSTALASAAIPLSAGWPGCSGGCDPYDNRSAALEMLVHTASHVWAQPAPAVQILRFYERQGLKLPQQPPLLMVKSAELGNAASQEQHPTRDREAPRRTGAAPVMHTR